MNRLVSTWLQGCLVAAVLLSACAVSRAQTVYSYTGGSQTYIVPAGVGTLRVKAWGGGGGAAAEISGTYGTGGGAGYVQSDIAVTPGQVITILVGQGGSGWNDVEGYANATFPNGGPAANFGGGGGGRTEINGTGFVLIAAGGGGGGYQFHGNAGQGGSGGSNIGGTGGSSPNNRGGTGGTLSAGGVGGTGTHSRGYDGAHRAGGRATGANIPGGSGGDGYFGGGAAAEA